MLDDIKGVIAQLIAAFPECFSDQAPKPLKVGIREDLLPQIESLAVSKTQIRLALAYYVQSDRYLGAVAQGGARYGLDGQPEGEVNPINKSLPEYPRRKRRSRLHPQLWLRLT